MTENLKTTFFVGVALVLTAAAVIINLPRGNDSGGVQANQPLYPDFTDPQDAASLEIVKVDEERGKISTFDVERNARGLWVIPSHGGYPADASAQMAAAANSLIGLEVIDIASELPTDQELYGVVQPEKSRLDAGGKSFGMMVTIKDKKGQNLTQLIIGKPVQGNTEQRFVRKAGQDPIYVVKLNVDQLSTNFSDWIEKDLLKVSPWDIDRVNIKDYQFILQQDGRGVSAKFDPRLEMTVGWDADANSWVLDKMTQFQRGKPVATGLQPDEELNKQKLDDLKSAIDNLQIIDAEAKPKGLGGDLSVDQEALLNAEIRDSLTSLGFFPQPVGKKVEFLGSNGEVNIGMKDGVEYVLRFGNNAGVEEGENAGKLRRYLFVSARLDESRLTPPALEPLPEKADVPAAPAPDAPAPEAAAPAASGDSEGDEGTGEKEAGEDAPPADAPAATEETPAAADAAPTDAVPADAPPTADADFELKRKRIERDNQRKLDEYKERRTKAENKVRELNARFAPWYYIISDDEFHRIHLGRTEVITERTGGGSEGFGVDALRDLEKDGPAGPPPPARQPNPNFGFPPM